MAKKRQSPANPNLSGKQLQFLEGVKDFQKEYGYAPSIREAGEFLGISSPATVHGYKSRLEKMGYLRMGDTRGLEVTEPRALAEAASLPLLGRVAAGLPIEALDHDEEIEAPSAMVGSGNFFALTVEGNSMIEDGILDGDKVVIRKQSTAENGQTVVALINNEATIKKYYKKGGKIELHPANEDYDIIHVPTSSDFRIEGVLKGVLRCV